MKKVDHLLVLIEKGDAESIVNQQHFCELYLEMLRYKLVEFRQGKIILTERGKKAQTYGMERALDRCRMEKELVPFSNKVGRRGRTFFLISLFLFLSTVLIMLIIESGGFILVHK